MKISPSRARAGLAVSSNGVVHLPLMCPAGASADCDADGLITLALTPSLSRTITRSEQATRVRVLAQFKGVEIASGATRLYAVRLAPTTFNALRRAGVRRVPATLRLSNRMAGGTPVVSSQRIWLRIPAPEVPVTG